MEGLITYENNVGAHVLTLNAHDVEEIQQLAMTLHSTAILLAMKHEEPAVLLAEVQQHLEEYVKAKTIQSEVMAVNHLVGTFYHHCGNRRLDQSMISIQGQQLLLRYIVASCRKEKKSKADFSRMVQAVQDSDAEAVCAALQENTDTNTPIILQYLQENGGTH